MIYFKGYGVAGTSADNCGVWSVSSNQNSRIADGVVSLTTVTPNGVVAKPSVTCCSSIQLLKNSLKNTKKHKTVEKLHLKKHTTQSSKH